MRHTPNILRLNDAVMGQDWTVRIVEKNDKYGKDMCLTHRKVKPLVEFYDADHDFDRGPNNEYLGQFVSRYCIDSLLGDEFSNPIGDGRGLCLHGGVDKWSIDGKAMKVVAEFLKDFVNLEGRKLVFKRVLESVLTIGHSGSDIYHTHMKTVIESLGKLNTYEIDSLAYVLANIENKGSE